MSGKVFTIIIVLVAFFMVLPEPQQESESNVKTVGYAATETETDENNAETFDNDFIIRNVRLYDGNQQFDSVDVAVVDGKIIKIEKSIILKTINKNDLRELNGQGKTLLPGLVDAHTHAYQNALSEALNFGVTTELDMFTMPEFANTHQRKRDHADNILAADLFSATILATAPDGHGTQFGFDVPLLRSPDEAQLFVTQRIDQGADYIKAVYNSADAKQHFFPSISKAILQALITAAHRQDKMLVVHVDNLNSAREAISMGANGIIHSFMDQVADDAFIALMQERNAFIIPTLTVQASFTQQSSGLALLKSETNLTYLNKLQRQQLKANFPDFGIPKDNLKKAFESVRKLSNAGVLILAGSDAPNPGTTHGLSLHAEIELLTQAGLTNEQAIHSATGAASKVFPIGERGLLKVGNYATMLLIDGNPFDSNRKDAIKDSQKINRIWKNGVEFNRLVTTQSSINSTAETKKFSPGLITDFNHQLTLTNMGSGLSKTTDQYAGGKSVVKVKLSAMSERGLIDTSSSSASSAAANQYLHVSGETRKGFMFPWAGIGYLLGKNMQNGVDLSAIKAIRFKAKAGAQTNKLSVLLFQSGNMQPIQKEFKLTTEWQTYRLELNKLNRFNLSDVSNISFVKSQSLGPFEFMLDDLYFE
ncbi:MAG: amidohydrolase family protein [Kangiellaceae bacterium]|nr:amidohydrolase family protein [Kangiellaceae bacterium]